MKRLRVQVGKRVEFWMILWRDERARHFSLSTTTRGGTRTADLLHVAAALELEQIAFIASIINKED